jgi:hypothetical protein
VNRTLRTKLVVGSLFLLALVAAPLALAARGGHADQGVQLAWKPGKTGANESLTLPAGSHPVLRAVVRGGAEGLRLVILRRADGARLFDGSLAGFRSLDLGRLPAALGDQTLDVHLAGTGRAGTTVGLRWVSGS